MLSAADSRLAGRDRAIAGLATALDAEALSAALQAAHPSCGIRRLTPYYVHYKPGTRCLVAFRVQDEESSGGQLAYAAAYGPDAGAKLPKACVLAQEMGVSPDGGVLILEDLDTAFFLFPADRRLKGLQRLAQPETRSNLLRRLFGKRPEFGRGRLQHLRYKPERRYVARLDTPEGRRAAIKFYNAQGYRAARHAAQAFAPREALALVPCAGYLDQHQVLGFDWQPGKSLHAMLYDGGADSGAWRRALELTGAALAGLHDQAPKGLERRSRDAERDRLMAQAGTLAQLCPELRTLSERLARDCLARLDDATPRLRALHGDFNAEQVLIGEEGRATILDLDWAQLGDPAADPGLFIAHLERAALRGHLPGGQVAPYADALLEGYRKVSEPPSKAAIRLYTAIGLFYLAAEPFRYREPDWPERVEALLVRARDILDHCRQSSQADVITTA